MAMRCCCTSSSARRLWWLRACVRRNSTADDKSCRNRSIVEERGPFASRLKSRGVLRMEGEDTFRFLQGLLSNDLRCLQQEPPPSDAANQPIARAPVLYSAVLNSQGRFLFDLFLYRLPYPTHKLDQRGSTDGSLALLCDVDATTKDELLDHLRSMMDHPGNLLGSSHNFQHLKAILLQIVAFAPQTLCSSITKPVYLRLHKLRAKVDFEDVSKELSVWQRYGGSLMQNNPDNKDAEVKNSGWGAASDPAAQASIEGNSKGHSWYKDPRCGDLGYRGVFPCDTIPPLVEADKEVDEIYYLLMRLDLGVAEGCTEIPKEKAIPLEYNLVWLNAISFEKGCYVGQELIARTHHRGVIRKRVMPIKFVNDSGEDMEQMVVPGAEILDTVTQKKVGDVTTVLGSSGLGVIRLEAASKDATQLIVKDTSRVHVRVYKPKWWPADWCPDDVRQS